MLNIGPYVDGLLETSWSANLLHDRNFGDGQEDLTIFLQRISSNKVDANSLLVIPEAPIGKKFNIAHSRPTPYGMKQIGEARINSKKDMNISSSDVFLLEAGISYVFNKRTLKKLFTAWYTTEASPVDNPEQLGAEFQQFVLSHVTSTIAQDYGRVSWFGSKTSSNIYENWMRGLWNSYFEYDPTLSRRIATVLPEDISTLTADAMIQIFRDMIVKQTSNMRALPKTEKEFWVDGDIYLYLQWAIADKTVGSEFYFRQTESGEPLMMFNGIEIKNYDFWKEYIENADPAGAGKGKYERRMMLTTKKNFAIAFNNVEENAMDIRFIADVNAEVIYIRTSLFADTTCIFPDEVVVALSQQNTPFIIGTAPTDAQLAQDWRYKDVENLESLFGGIMIGTTGATSANVSATVGQTVTIRGNNFTGATGVTVGATAQGSFTVVDDNTITFVATGAETTETVTVLSPNGNTVAEQTMTIA